VDGLAIAASTMEIQAAIESGFVRSIYRPTKGAFILHIFAGQNRRLLIDPREAAIRVTRLAPPNPATPDPFVMFLRRHLRGGRILSVCQRGWDRVVVFEIERREGRATRSYQLVAELIGVRGNLFLLERGKVLGSAHRDRRNRPGSEYVAIPVQEKLAPMDVSVEDLVRLPAGEWSERALVKSIDGLGRATAVDLLRDLDEGVDAGARARAVHARLRAVLSFIEKPSPFVVRAEGRATFYPVSLPAEPAGTFGEALDAVSEASDEGMRIEEAAVGTELRRAMARRKRTLEKLREWLDDADGADRLQSLGDLLMIHHTEIAPKADEVVLTDPATEEEKTIRLLPSLGAIENAQRLYERAKRLRRGRPHVTSRIKRLEAEIEILAKATDAHEKGRLIEERALDLLPKAAAKRPRSEPASRGLRIDGFTIHVGKSASDNDRLLRAASPDDLWLHAKGFAGSHVVIRRGGRQEIPDTVVQQAARLAAQHSKARGERRVEVLMTVVKHVRKPKGAAPGLANVMKGDTLIVELQEEGE